jgi:hypothetical protein
MDGMEAATQTAQHSLGRFLSRMRQLLILSVAKEIDPTLGGAVDGESHVDHFEFSNCRHLAPFAPVSTFCCASHETSVAQAAMRFLTANFCTFDLTNPACSAGILGCNPPSPILKPP